MAVIRHGNGDECLLRDQMQNVPAKLSAGGGELNTLAVLILEWYL
jgi:hypothetical protein